MHNGVDAILEDDARQGVLVLDVAVHKGAPRGVLWHVAVHAHVRGYHAARVPACSDRTCFGTASWGSAVNGGRTRPGTCGQGVHALSCAREQRHARLLLSRGMSSAPIWPAAPVTKKRGLSAAAAPCPAGVQVHCQRLALHIGGSTRGACLQEA